MTTRARWNLIAAQRAYHAASEEATRALLARNDAIREALDAGMRPVDVARATGLTRGRIAQLAARANAGG